MKLNFLLFLLCIPALAGEIANGLKPEGAAQTLQFTEDLRFGGDGAEHMIWSGIASKLIPGPRGKMYVVDQGEDRILEFGPHGSFRRTIAGRGNGPGEYQRLATFAVFDDGRAVGLDYYNDMGRFFWYDTTLKFVEERSPPESLSQVYFSPDGSLAAFRGFQLLKDGRITLVQGVMDQLKTTHRAWEWTIPSWDGSRATDPEYLTERFSTLMKSRFGPKGIVAVGHHNQYYSAMSNNYRITRYHRDGSAQLIITKQHKPRIKSEAQIENFIEQQVARFREPAPPSFHPIISKALVRRSYERAEFPLAYDPILALLPLPDGSLLVVNQQDEAGTAHADLFHADGRFAGEVSMPHHALVDADDMPNMYFRGAFAYAMETNEDGDFEAVRYRYRSVPVP